MTDSSLQTASFSAPEFGARVALVLVIMVVIFSAVQVQGIPVSGDSEMLSCSADRRAAVLKALPEHSLVVSVRSKFDDDDQEYCAYYELDVLAYPPKPKHSKSYKMLEQKKREMEACTSCTSEVTLLDKRGAVVEGPVNETKVAPAEAPGEIKELEATFDQQQGKIKVTWSGPCSTGDYKLTYKYTELQHVVKDTGIATVTVNGTTNHLLENVTPDALYTICVSCISDKGEGNKVCVKIRTPAGVLPAPVDLEATEETTSSFRVSWLPPSVGAADASVAWYKLSVAVADVEEAPDTTYQLGSHLLSKIVDNLQPGTKYRIKVKAIDASGNDGQNTSVTAKTKAADQDKSFRGTPSPPEGGSIHGRESQDSDEERDVFQGSGEGTAHAEAQRRKGAGGYHPSNSGGQNSNEVTVFTKFLSMFLALGVLIMTNVEGHSLSVSSGRVKFTSS